MTLESIRREELRGLELHADSALTCENSDIRDGNDAKAREMTCGTGRALTASTSSAWGRTTADQPHPDCLD